MNKSLFSLAACAAALMMGAPADAAVMTLNFDLTASNFSEIGGASVAATADPLLINFTLTFDDSVSTLDGVTSGLIVNSSNLLGATPFAYTYVHDTGYGDYLLFGTDLTPYSACAISGSSIGHNTLCASFSNVTTSAPSVDFVSLGNAQYWWDAQDTRLRVTTAAVPEPASWAMMIGGLAITGAALRRRRTSAIRFA